jgi:hypothetical protein
VGVREREEEEEEMSALYLFEKLSVSKEAPCGTANVIHLLQRLLEFRLQKIFSSFEFANSDVTWCKES